MDANDRLSLAYVFRFCYATPDANGELGPDREAEIVAASYGEALETLKRKAGENVAILGTSVKRKK